MSEDAMAEQISEIILKLDNRAVKAEAERDELREALLDLLRLKQAADDGVSGQYPNYAQHLRDAWKLAAELTHFEDGP
jgi:hypothetical protein